MTTNPTTNITKTGPSGSTAIARRPVLVTAASRGLGQAPVEEALRRGTARVYAGVRHPSATMAESWRAGVAQEPARQNAALVAA